MEIRVKYLDYSNVFLIDSAAKLSEHTSTNNHHIDIELSKQPLYRLIYSLGLVDFEILKIYIEANLANKFIRPSKSLVEHLSFL